MGGATAIEEVTTATKQSTVDILDTGYENFSTLFWCMVVFYTSIAILSVIGNGLVLYAAYGNKNTGPLRYLDEVVKSLAIADLLYGFMGTPLGVYKYYIGMSCIHDNWYHTIIWLDQMN